MKCTVIREAILKPLQQVVGVIEKRLEMPVLQNILMEAKAREVWLTGTDLEIVQKARVPVESAEDEGSFTLPARKLLDICRALPEGTLIHLESEENRIQIKAGKGRYNLSTLPSRDFPMTEEGIFHQRITIFKKDLREMIDRVSFSMAQQDVRYYLNGLLMEQTKDRLRVVATDGHRLAISEMSIENTADVTFSIIIPRKAVMELNRLLLDEEGSVLLGFSENHLLASTDEWVFQTKLIEGRFPDYQAVLPKGGDKHVLIDREGFKSALSRVSIVFNEKFRGVRLLLAASTLKLVAINLEQEEAEEEIEVTYGGAPLEVGFNIRYLLDVLSAIKSNKVDLLCHNQNSSALILEHDRPGTQYVIMPMRL